MMQVEPVTLVGRHVQLEPLTIEHLPEWLEVGLSGDIFRWFPWQIDTPETLTLYLQGCLAFAAEGKIVPFATRDLASGRVVGGTSFLAIEPAHFRLEIGGTWLAPAWQRSGCNTEAKLLQLTHCFEQLGCMRVEFKTDALNTASRAALLRIGAKEEGTFRQHMLCPGGRRRDSVYFSVIDREWPTVKQRLAARLQPG
ncbi:MAG: GNAT family N-acetyltransferase [Pirellulales bacterium]|nr:GNAT family N-acetyltransferase [Pirellulales bacterium]